MSNCIRNALTLIALYFLWYFYRTLPRKERDGYTIEDEIDPTHCGDRITRNNVKQTAKQCGYCEICGVKYNNLAKVIRNAALEKI